MRAGVTGQRSAVNGSSAGTAGRATPRWLMIVALPLAVPLVAALRAITPTYRAMGDQALIEIRARDVFSSDTPLAGLIGRFDWNHPGPALFWLLSPVAQIARRTSTPVRIGAAVLCVVALAAALALAWTLGRRFFLAMTVVIGLALLGMPTSAVTLFWNPSFPVLLVPLLVVLAARVAAGHVKDVIGIVVVGTVMAQTHVGTTVIVVSIAVFALVCVGLDAHRHPERRRELWSVLLGSALIAAVLWLPPIVGTLRDAPGNLRYLVRYFVHAPDGHIGLERAARMVAAEYAWRPTWLGGAGRIGTQSYLGFRIAGTSPAWLLVLPFTTVLTGLVVAHRQRDRLWFRYLVLTGTLTVVAVVAVSRTDLGFTYTFSWIKIIAPMTVVFPMATVVTAFIARRPRAGAPVIAVTAVLVVVVAFAAVPRYSRRDGALTRAAQTQIARISVQLDREPLRGRAVAVRYDELDFELWVLFVSLINELDRRGADVVVPETYFAEATWGEGRVGPQCTGEVVWRMVATPQRLAALMAQPGARLIWSRGAAAGIVERPVDRCRR